MPVSKDVLLGKFLQFVIISFTRHYDVTLGAHETDVKTEININFQLRFTKGMCYLGHVFKFSYTLIKIAYSIINLFV